MSHIQNRLMSISQALSGHSRGGQQHGSARVQDAIESVSSRGSRESEGSGITLGSQDTSESGESHASRSREAPLAQHPATVPIAVQGQQATAEPTTVKPKKSIIIWVVLIVIVLLVVFGLILYFSHKKRKRAQEEAKQNGRQNPTPPGFAPTSRNNPFDQIGKLPSRDQAPPKQNQPHQQQPIDQAPNEDTADQDISPL